MVRSESFVSNENNSDEWVDLYYDVERIRRYPSARSRKSRKPNRTNGASNIRVKDGNNNNNVANSQRRGKYKFLEEAEFLKVQKRINSSKFQNFEEGDNLINKYICIPHGSTHEKRKSTKREKKGKSSVSTTKKSKQPSFEWERDQTNEIIMNIRRIQDLRKKTKEKNYRFIKQRQEFNTIRRQTNLLNQ